MFIPVILGTARKGRQSEKAASFMLEQAEDFGLETELIDVRDFRLEATSRKREKRQVKEFSALIEKADGLIIVSPEYNHGYPGELKMMLDMIYEEYHKKPAGICGVSVSFTGGVRMVEQLRQVLIELHMVPIRESVYFSNITELFDKEGKMKDDSYKGMVKVFLEQLTWYAKVLKGER
jgi:NAD(P)H-dependent FMN reductase